MGAGKSTLGEEVGRRIGRRFVDLDRQIEDHAAVSISDFFATRGEAEFRAVEQKLASDLLDAPGPAVIVLGGGAILSTLTRRKLQERAVTVLIDVDVEEAWRRSHGSTRPLAASEEQFKALFAERRVLYEEAADSVARDADDLVLAAAGVLVKQGSFDRLADLLPAEGAVALVADSHVVDLHRPHLEGALHTVPSGESAKDLSVVERLWSELRLDRFGTIVALGGGSTTDVAGFVAATYMRGVGWVAVPTTLVGQVDAAIGGKTAINVPEGKNLVGAFHWPVRTVVDPALLSTLPEPERRNGTAEVVKTGLLAGEALWELPEAELVRRCAAFKAAVCLRDPEDRGERAMLNFGHTFGHALEAASGYELPHGEAVALGLVAALRLSGLEGEARSVEDLLRPERPRLDPELAWSALLRDKKAKGGRLRLVLLEAPGKPLLRVELPEPDVRRALDSLLT